MRQHHNAIRNWHSIVNNSISAESKIKTYVPPVENQPVVESQPIEVPTEEQPIETIKEKSITTSTSTIQDTTTIRLSNFNNKK